MRAAGGTALRRPVSCLRGAEGSGRPPDRAECISGDYAVCTCKGCGLVFLTGVPGGSSYTICFSKNKGKDGEVFVAKMLCKIKVTFCTLRNWRYSGWKIYTKQDKHVEIQWLVGC